MYIKVFSNYSQKNVREWFEEHGRVLTCPSSSSDLILMCSISSDNVGSVEVPPDNIQDLKLLNLIHYTIICNIIVFK